MGHSADIIDLAHIPSAGIQDLHHVVYTTAGLTHQEDDLSLGEERFQKLLECTKLRLEPCVIPEEEQEAKIYMPVEKAQDLMAKNAEFSELVKDLALDIR